MDEIEIVCTTCGERNPARNEFCYNCGTFLAWEDSRKSRPLPATDPQPAADREHNQVASPGEGVDVPAGTHHDSATRDQVRAPDAYGIYNEVPDDRPDDPATFDTPESAPDRPAPDAAEVAATSQPDSFEPPQADAATQPVEPTAWEPAETLTLAEVPVAPSPAGPAEFDCPVCGTANPDTRRYCRHCGAGFYPEWSSSAAAGPSWSPEAVAAHDKEAERAYRRSLPVLYRWRRVLIGIVVLALCGGLGFVIARGPAAMAEDGWHQVMGDYVTIAGVSVKVVPKTATAPGSNPQALIDGTAQEWTMIWRPSGTATCGAAPGTGVVEFSFPATRVRRIVIASGLAPDNPNSLTQPRPKVVGVSFDDGPCQTLNLDNKPDQQGFRIDSGQPVQKLSLGISEAYPGDANQISLTEVWIQTYPG